MRVLFGWADHSIHYNILISVLVVRAEHVLLHQGLILQLLRYILVELTLSFRSTIPPVFKVDRLDCTQVWPLSGEFVDALRSVVVFVAAYGSHVVWIFCADLDGVLVGLQGSKIDWFQTRFLAMDRVPCDDFGLV